MYHFYLLLFWMFHLQHHQQVRIRLGNGAKTFFFFLLEEGETLLEFCFLCCSAGACLLCLSFLMTFLHNMADL